MNVIMATHIENDVFCRLLYKRSRVAFPSGVLIRKVIRMILFFQWRDPTDSDDRAGMPTEDAMTYPANDRDQSTRHVLDTTARAKANVLST